MALSSFWTAGACSIYEAQNLANDWNLESTFHGQVILNPVPAIRDLQHKIQNPQRAIQKPRFSLMHLILEECQPVYRRVSFHKRRFSVRKSEKDAIGSHLIQPAKIKISLSQLSIYITLLNSICRIDLVTTPSKGFIEGFFEIQIFPLQGKYVCGLFGERSERILDGQK